MRRAAFLRISVRFPLNVAGRGDVEPAEGGGERPVLGMQNDERMRDASGPGEAAVEQESWGLGNGRLLAVGGGHPSVLLMVAPPLTVRLRGTAEGMKILQLNASLVLYTETDTIVLPPDGEVNGKAIPFYVDPPNHPGLHRDLFKTFDNMFPVFCDAPPFNGRDWRDEGVTMRMAKEFAERHNLTLRTFHGFEPVPECCDCHDPHEVDCESR